MTTMMTTMVEKNELMVEVKKWVSTQKVVSCEKTKKEFIDLMTLVVDDINKNVGGLTYDSTVANALDYNCENIRRLRIDNIDNFISRDIAMEEYNLSIVYIDHDYCEMTGTSIVTTAIYPNTIHSEHSITAFLAYENEVDLFRFFFDDVVSRACSNRSLLTSLFELFFEQHPPVVELKKLKVENNELIVEKNELMVEIKTWIEEEIPMLLTSEKARAVFIELMERNCNILLQELGGTIDDERIIGCSKKPESIQEVRIMKGKTFFDDVKLMQKYGLTVVYIKYNTEKIKYSTNPSFNEDVCCLLFENELQLKRYLFEQDLWMYEKSLLNDLFFLFDAFFKSR